MMKIFEFLFFGHLVWGFKECSSGSDTAKPQLEYLVTPFFPHRTPRAVKCKFSLSVNYGEYIKIVPDVIELPCAGGNGIFIEEEGGRSGPFCGNKRMPGFISRDVKFDIHIIIDTPLRGARVKIGYKAVTSPKGPNVAKARGSKNMPIALLKMGPDQGQGQLQQQNSQNVQNDMLNRGLDQQGVGPQEIGPPSNSWGKQQTNRRGFDKNKQWVSETYNPVLPDYPASYPDPGKKKSEGGGAGIQLVLPVIVLMILVGILIVVIHKRRQKMKEDLKKLENSPPGAPKVEPRKPDFIPIQPGGSMEKTEPTIEQINQVIEATNNAAEIESKNISVIEAPSNKVVSAPTSKIVSAPSNKVVSAPSSKVVSAPTNKVAPIKTVPPTPANTLVAKETESARSGRPTKNMDKKTISTDSAISTRSKDSQATTAPSIKSECPTRPLRAPVTRPPRKQAPKQDEDDDRPSY